MQSTAVAIDPFGLSKTCSRLTRVMGMDSYIINRVDSEFKAKRIAKQDLNMKDEAEGDGRLFLTHLLPYHYSSPRTFAVLNLLNSNPMGK